jgi:hypothetical protein
MTDELKKMSGVRLPPVLKTILPEPVSYLGTVVAKPDTLELSVIRDGSTFEISLPSHVVRRNLEDGDRVHVFVDRNDTIEFVQPL